MRKKKQKRYTSGKSDTSPSDSSTAPLGHVILIAMITAGIGAIDHTNAWSARTPNAHVLRYHRVHNQEANNRNRPSLQSTLAYRNRA